MPYYKHVRALDQSTRMSKIDRRSVLRHGLGFAALSFAGVGIVALKASLAGAPGAPEPARGDDPVLEEVRASLERRGAGASSTP